MAVTEARWKEKYARLLAEYEQLEQHSQGHIELLQRALVRSSLAAEGQDAKLDKLLQSLRDTLRKPDSLLPLTHLIEDIERSLLANDDQRQTRTEAIRDALERLSTQLLTYKPDGPNKRALKQFQKSIQNSLQLSYNLHSLLQDISQLQADVLQQPETVDKPSAFARFFGKGQTPAANPSSPASTTDYKLDSALPAEEAQEPSSEPASTAHAPADAHDAQLPSVLKTIETTLLHLLQELPLSDAEQNIADALTQQIQRGLDCHELASALDGLAQLVLQITDHTQQEFGNYLEQLHQKLHHITSNTQQTQTDYQDSIEAADAFDTQMHSQVSDLHQDVQQAHDLVVLKARVDQRLNRFLDSLNQFQQQRKQSERGFIDRLKQLNKRVHLIETEAAHLNSKLVEQHKKARQDPLTGLPNRAAWDERLAIEYTRLKREPQPLLMAVIDIDFFKRINDNYGHLAGDKVLKILANNLRRSIRETDFIARFGGEEFVLLLPNTGLEHGEQLLNKLRELIANCPFHFKGEPVQITFSAGIGQLDSNEPVEQAFARIDQALYAAKHAGRNRVLLA